MAVTDKIHIDFQFFSTGDPRVLVIIDTSIWSYIVDKPAIIEIIPPGRTKALVYSFLKSKSNVFNSSNLYLSPVGTFNDMPDGIYKVTVKGSPSTLCTHRDILKTDKARLDLYKLYSSLGFESNEEDSEILEKISEIKLLIEAAEAAVCTGETYKGEKLLKRAVKELNGQKECKDCN